MLFWVAIQQAFQRLDDIPIDMQCVFKAVPKFDFVPLFTQKLTQTNGHKNDSRILILSVMEVYVAFVILNCHPAEHR